MLISHAGGGSWEQPCPSVRTPCSLYVLERLNINVEVLPVPEDKLQGNLMEMHQDRCCPLFCL